MDYELTYKKVHNTLKPMDAPNKYGDEIGKKISNLIAPTIEGYDSLISTKTVSDLKAEIEAAVEESNNYNVYSYQYLSSLGIELFNSAYSPTIDINLTFGSNDDSPVIHSDFYLPGLTLHEYTLSNGMTYNLEVPSIHYKPKWYIYNRLDDDNTAIDDTLAVPNFARFGSTVTSRFAPDFIIEDCQIDGDENDTAHQAKYCFCSSKIPIESGLTYHLQVIDRKGVNATPQKWQIGIQILGTRTDYNIIRIQPQESDQNNYSLIGNDESTASFHRFWDMSERELDLPNTIPQTLTQTLNFLILTLDSTNNKEYLTFEEFVEAKDIAFKVVEDETIDGFLNADYQLAPNGYNDSYWNTLYDWKNNECQAQLYAIVWLKYLGSDSDFENDLELFINNYSFCLYQSETGYEVDEDNNILRYLSVTPLPADVTTSAIASVRYDFWDHLGKFFQEKKPIVSVVENSDSTKSLSVSLDYDSLTGTYIDNRSDLTNDQEKAEFICNRLNMMGYTLALIPCRESNDRANGLPRAKWDGVTTYNSKNPSFIRTVDSTNPRKKNGKNWMESRSKTISKTVTEVVEGGTLLNPTTAIYDITTSIVPSISIGTMHLNASNNYAFTFEAPSAKNITWDNASVMVAPNTSNLIWQYHAPKMPSNIYDYDSTNSYTPFQYTFAPENYIYSTRFSGWREKDHSDNTATIIIQNLGLYDYSKALLPTLSRLEPYEGSGLNGTDSDAFVKIGFAYCLIDNDSYEAQEFKKRLYFTPRGSLNPENPFINTYVGSTEDENYDVTDDILGDMFGAKHREQYVQIRTSNDELYGLTGPISDPIYISKYLTATKTSSGADNLLGDLPELSWHDGAITQDDDGIKIIVA